MAMNDLPANTAMDPDTWREQSKGLGQVLSFSLQRSYLQAPAEQLAGYLRLIPPVEAEVPTSWLKVETVGDASAIGGLEASSVMRIALETCHRPVSSRLYFLVRSDGLKAEVYLGLRGIGLHGDSEAHAESAKSFLEAAWPATKLTRVANGSAIRGQLSKLLEKRHGKIVITGVPRPQSKDGVTICGVECLLEGLAGKSFAFLVIADPIGPAVHEEILGRARDLLGALRTLQQVHVTRSASSAVATGKSVGKGQSLSVADTVGASESNKKHSQIHKLTDFVTAGSLALTPLIPVMGLVAALSYIAGEVLPRDLTTTASESQTRTVGSSISTTDSTTHTDTRGVSVAQTYASVHLEKVSESLEGLITRMQGQRLWEVGAYLLADGDEDAHDAASQFTALLNGPRLSGEEPMRFKTLDAFWRHGIARELTLGRRPALELVADDGHRIVPHPLGAPFAGLSTPLNTDELALFCLLPRREVAGIRVRPFANFSVNAAEPPGRTMELGQVLRGDEPTPSTFKVGLDSLTKNALVTGTVGSGKTNTVKSMLTQLLAAGVPFLVIEPAKSEYTDWAHELNQQVGRDGPRKIAIYTPGSSATDASVLDLHLNPFYVGTPELFTMHIERLKTLLMASLPMQEAMPMLLESVLYALYRHNGWFAPPAESQANRRYPTVTGALVTKARTELRRPSREGSHPHADTLLASVVLEKGYDERVSANFIGALRTRLAFLGEKDSWKRAVFDCETSTPPSQLFDRPAVVNLSDLHADRPFAAGLLLSYLHEYRRSTSGDRARASLRHVTVLEEAHCLLEPAHHVSAESMDPKGMLSAMCAEMLSEMRAWGEGFVIVDQYPTRLIADAVKNTNLKIVHRLPARDDQEVVATAMSLSKGQAQIIPFLRPGQAIVAGDDDDVPMRIQVRLHDGGST